MGVSLKVGLLICNWFHSSDTYDEPFEAEINLSCKKLFWFLSKRNLIRHLQILQKEYFSFGCKDNQIKFKHFITKFYSSRMGLNR